MKKPLTIGLLTAAIIAGALSLVRVDGGNRAPATVLTEAAAADGEAAPAVVRMAQLAVNANAPAVPYMLDYQRGPRIIHVPQPGEGAQERTSERVVKKPAARATLERRPEPAATADDEDDDVEVAPSPPPRPRAPLPKPRAAAPPQPPAAITPRWKLRSDQPPAPPPPPPGPRRAVLSAPPPDTFGPTPIRPTPRFDGKAEQTGKFTAPSEPAPPPANVSEAEPPVGYSPPATPEPPVAYSPPASPEPPVSYSPPPLGYSPQAED